MRSGFEEMKASPWEKEDAIHEGIPILNFMVPKEFTHANGKLTGVLFEKVKAQYDDKGRRNLVPSGEPDEHVPCDDVLIAVGQENSFPWIERDAGIEFDKWGMPKVDPKTMRSSNPRVFFGGDSAFGPKNIIWAVAHGHEAAVSIDKMLNGEDITDRPIPAVELMSQKMGIHEWSYDNEIALDKRYKVPHREKTIALKDIKAEVELGLRSAASARGSRTLPELRRADDLHLLALHRMRCLRRYLPDGLHHLHRERRGSRVAPTAEGAGQQSRAGSLCRQ